MAKHAGVRILTHRLMQLKEAKYMLPSEGQ